MLYNAVVPKPGGKSPIEAVTQELIERVESRLRAARTKMLFRKNWAFFSYLSMHLQPVAVPGLRTCATDGENFLYDPVTLEPESVEWMEFDWAHEVMHVIGMDLSRGPKDDIIIVDGAGNPVKLFNLACDLWNNLKLEEEGFTIPPFVPIDRNYKGWSKDQIYDDLRKKVKQGSGQLPKGRVCGGLKCGGHGKGKSLPEKYKDLTGKDLAEWKPDKAEEDKWKARAKEALEAAKVRGTEPGFAQTLVQKLLTPKLPWKEILWRFCTRGGKEWRYRPPSRTGAARGIVLPRLCPDDDEIEHGVLIFDTSGSIADSDLEEFCSEAQSILTSVRMEVTCLMVDAAVHDVYHFEAGEFDWKALKFTGRGGTDFRPGFRKVRDLGIKPSFLIYFTDTYGAFPEKAPEYPVLWAVTHPQGTVPWGEKLTLREEAI